MSHRAANHTTHKHANLHERIKKLLVSHEWSDCSFSITGKVFKAHKLILAASSPVFEAMFYGPWSTEATVDIIDIHPDTFQSLLNYIYTDSIEISSIYEALELLYAARKYILDYLSEMCIKYVQSNINMENVIEVLNYPKYLQDTQLFDLATNFFCKHARYLFQEKTMFTVSGLKAVLESDHMNVDEKDLIKYVFEWSSYVCEQNNIPNTIENRHDILHQNNIFESLRFLTLFVHELEEIAIDTNNVLYSHEIDNIINNIRTDNESDVIGSIKLPRKTLELKWLYCNRIPVKPTAPIVINANNNVVETRIRVNKAILLNALIVPTRMALSTTSYNDISHFYTEDICVTIQNERDNSINFILLS